MSRLLKLGAFAAAATLLATQAQALAFGTLSFNTPTGTVLSNQSIDIYVTFTLDEASEALATDGSGTVIAGLTEQDLLDRGIDPMSVIRTNVNNFSECSGTFFGQPMASCDPGAYEFDFNLDPPSFVGAQDIDFQPGDSASYFFGTLNPVGGNAPAGFYTYYNAGFIIQVTYMNPDYDPDVENSREFLTEHFNLAQTCPGQDDRCAFTREVLAAGVVPEPATWAMMITGFGAAGAVLRRRRNAGSLT